MPTYRELAAPAELEAEVLAFWKAERIFEASLSRPAPKGTFVFYEGPPTANGMPHNGHVLTRVVKDLFPRYRTMRGYKVERKAGWDTHGLPVEVEVEKLLGIHGRAAIEAYGLEPFARKCIDSVFTYTQEWEELTERIGFWIDQPNAYVTYHRSYVESVWWALSELFNKGLLYQDYKVVWWWPQGGTALSSGEVGEGYKTVDDPSVTVRFRVRGQPGVSLLAWTTTPWTLPSNVALAVNSSLDYAYVRVGEETLIVADALRAGVLGEDSEVLRVVKGSALVGLEYEPLYTMAEPSGGRAYVVVAGPHVEAAQTGIVHTAPAFGEDDFALRKAEGLGFLQLVGPDGKFVDGCDALTGMFCKDADKEIIRDLKDRGLLFKSETLRHEYPFCPRADQDPLIQYARPAWFIRTTSAKAQALANNASVGWSPETIRDGRFGDFLRNNVDWALSRERFWGTPLNIWICAACETRVAPASTSEIIARGGVLAETDNPHLAVHKPWIDAVTLRCDCGGEMRRVPEVIDCWFDSGCMPFAQWGWPHAGHAEFTRSFPADFISEAVDQTRGWFYSLLMVSTLVFDDETCRKNGLEPVGFPRPYRNCIVLGHVCDAEGKKESKSKGNYTSPDLVLKGSMKVRTVADPTLKRGQIGMKPPQVKSLGLDAAERMTTPDGAPFEVVARPVKAKDTVAMHPDDVATYGAVVTFAPPFPAPGSDAFRWLFFASNPPWNNTRISLKAILEGQREFLLRLKNVHQFFVLNAGDHAPCMPEPSHVLDCWILHELDALTRAVTASLDAYRPYEAARALSDFVDGLSNWYVRRSRDRFGGPDADEARDTLYAVLLTLSKLIAPFVPFMAEAMFQSLGAPGAPSVHLADWPEPAEAWQSPGLALDMSLVRELASLGLSARANVGVRVRQPLAAAEVILADSARARSLAPLLPLLREELNVREVRFSADAGAFVTFRVKPDFKALGKKLGKDMKACQTALSGMDGGSVRAAILAGGLDLALPNGNVTLSGEDVIVEVAPKEGFQASGSAAAVVALHATLDEDLYEEGLSREIISRVQASRKAMELGYDDRVILQVVGGERTRRAMARFGAAICSVTKAMLGVVEETAPDVVIDGESVGIFVARAG